MSTTAALLPLPVRVQQSILAQSGTPVGVRKACVACGLEEDEITDIIQECESFTHQSEPRPLSIEYALKHAHESLSFTEAGIKFSASSGIIELSGGPASSKTQLCMQLAATTSAYNVPVHYIDADGDLSVTRLEELGANLDNITVIRPLDWTQLAAAVNLLPLLIHSAPAVIIIDSVTHLLRHLPSMPSMSSTDQQEEDEKGVKYAVLGNIAATLSTLTQCITVVTNQFTTDIATGRQKPALGDVWSTILDKRIILNHVEGGIKSVDMDDPDDAWLIEITPDSHAVRLPDI